MDARTAKQDARKAGLDLYYSTEWQSWGLIDPACNVEGLWMSPAELRDMERSIFQRAYIATMRERIEEHGDAEDDEFLYPDLVATLDPQLGEED
jgi:hypothetical protein